MIHDIRLHIFIVLDADESVYINPPSPTPMNIGVKIFLRNMRRQLPGFRVIGRARYATAPTEMTS